MNAMNADSILDVLLNQVAVEEPSQVADLQHDTDGPLSPMIDLIRRVVLETLDNAKNGIAEIDENDARVAIAATLARNASVLGHAATALWQSAILEKFDHSGNGQTHSEDSRRPQIE